MEVHINLLQQNEIVASTQFIFVAQKEGKSWPVPGLHLDSEVSKAEFEKGSLRSSKRREKAAKSLDLTAPLRHEVEIMHDIYLRTKKLESTGRKDFKYIKETKVDSHRLMHKQFPVENDAEVPERLSHRIVTPQSMNCFFTRVENNLVCVTPMVQLGLASP